MFYLYTLLIIGKDVNVIKLFGEVMQCVLFIYQCHRKYIMELITPKWLHFKWQLRFMTKLICQKIHHFQAFRGLGTWCLHTNIHQHTASFVVIYFLQFSLSLFVYYDMICECYSTVCIMNVVINCKGRIDRHDGNIVSGLKIFPPP